MLLLAKAEQLTAKSMRVAFKNGPYSRMPWKLLTIRCLKVVIHPEKLKAGYLKAYVTGDLSTEKKEHHDKKPISIRGKFSG